MSTAMIRHEKFERKKLHLLYRHNERKNQNYSNKNISKDKTKFNFNIKTTNNKNYIQIFDELKQKYHLKGQIKKNSNIVCSYVVTAEPSFFKELTYEEIKRYFYCAYSFIANFKNLGEQYIISAVVHMDETTPHMHLAYIPVVHTKDKNGKPIDKICCAEFWKGKNSYKQLQNNFYTYMNVCGFDIKRIKDNKNNTHIEPEELKKLTKFYEQQELKQSYEPVKEVITDDIELIKKDYKSLINKYNDLADTCTKLLPQKANIDYEISKLTDSLKQMENSYNYWKRYANRALSYISSKYRIPFNELKEEINNHIKQLRFLHYQNQKNNNEKENNYVER